VFLRLLRLARTRFVVFMIELIHISKWYPDPKNVGFQIPRNCAESGSSERDHHSAGYCSDRAADHAELSAQHRLSEACNPVFSLFLYTDRL
jgi:hypothetical protein